MLVLQRRCAGYVPRGTCGYDLVKRRDAQSCSDVAALFRVVVEVRVFEQTVFITDQPVSHNSGRIEFNLKFDIFRHREERARQLLNENPLRLLERIDVGVIAVPLIGELFKGGVFVIADSKTQHGQ